MSKKKPLWEMTTDELAEATGEFNSEIAAKTFGSPTAEQRAQLARAKRKRGRPPIGKGVCVISVSIEKDLLRAVDALAKRKRAKRAAFISTGLKAILDGRVTL